MERKLGFLMKHVYDDPRTPWRSTMNHCNLSNMSYDQTIQLLHHACQTTPESMQTVKMCNVVKQSSTAHQSTTAPQAKSNSIPPTTGPSPIPKQYCRNYQTNKCRRAPIILPVWCRPRRQPRQQTFPDILHRIPWRIPYLLVLHRPRKYLDIYSRVWSKSS